MQDFHSCEESSILSLGAIFTIMNRRIFLTSILVSFGIKKLPISKELPIITAVRQAARNLGMNDRYIYCPYIPFTTLPTLFDEKQTNLT